jgi:putative redox protein
LFACVMIFRACTHGPSGRQLETDAPKDNEGRGESFSPTDLLATALGSCMLTVMGIYARRKGWKLDGARARVEKHMATAPVRRIGKLVVEFEMPPHRDAGRPLERAADTCPVPGPHRGESERLRLALGGTFQAQKLRLQPV